jgi:predicted phage terminase large subunit-like protein
MNSLPTIDNLEAERILCQRSFAYFIKRAWRHIIPDDLQWNWHLDAIAEHFEAVARGDINRLLINIPPGTSKSTVSSVMFPAWMWGPGGRPGFRFIGASHDQGLAVRDSRLTRELVTTRWYQRLWDIALTGDQNEKLYFENTARGFRQACAVASMTGRRGHCILWDDPLSPEKAFSQAHRDAAIRILTETVPTRLNDPTTSAIIVVMQRLHEADPSGHIIANDFGYEHLCIPMEFEPERRRTTSIGWTDPRTNEGELLDPVRFPPEVIARDRAAMGSYAWAGQMQQRPSPRGGGLFRDEWWQYWSQIPQIDWRVIVADTAMKAKTSSDYSVFQCWGRTRDGRAALIDQIRGKWEAPELITQARAFWAKHKAVVGQGPLRALKVEDKASGTGLIQQLRREGGIPIVALPSHQRDKVERANDVIPFTESGNVILPKQADWLSDLLSEVSAFPMGAHDDQVDTLIYGVADILEQKATYNIRAL